MSTRLASSPNFDPQAALAAAQRETALTTVAHRPQDRTLGPREGYYGNNFANKDDAFGRVALSTDANMAATNWSGRRKTRRVKKRRATRRAKMRTRRPRS